MTILRPLSVMTPGPGDPEVAYAKQGTYTPPENPFMVALIWTSLDDNVYVYIYTYDTILYYYYYYVVYVHPTSDDVVGSITKNKVKKNYNHVIPVYII